MPVNASPILLVTTSIITLLVIVPLGFLLFGTFWSTSPGIEGEFTLANIQEGFNLGQHTTLLSNTIVFAAGSTILAMSIGITMAFIIQRTDTRMRKVFDTLILLTFAFPTFMMDMAWILLLSPKNGIINFAVMGLLGLEEAPFNVYTIWGMVWSQGLGLGALAYLLISPAFMNMDASLEEASIVSGAGVRKTFAKITFPILYPAIISTSVFLFMIGLRSFETPAFIGQLGGVKVYTNAIYENLELTFPPNYGLASSQSVVLVIMAVAALVLYLRATRRLSKFVSITGKGYKPKTISLGKWRYMTFAIMVGYIAGAILMPVVLLFLVSLVPFYTVTRNPFENITLENYTVVLKDDLMWNAAVNSTLIAVSTALLTTMAGALVSYAALRTRLKGKRMFEGVGMLPQGYPGIVLGFGLLWAFLSVFRPIFGTPWALVVAYLILFLPLSIRSSSNAMVQLHSELEEAASVSGASWLHSFRSIMLPLLRPALSNSFFLVLINSFRELGTAVLLSGPGMYVIPVLILFFWRTGFLPKTAAATLIYGGSIILVIILARLISRIRSKR